MCVTGPWWGPKGGRLSGRPRASRVVREGDRARQGVPWGGARWSEALGRGAAVVPCRPGGGAPGGHRVVGTPGGVQARAGGRFGARGRSPWVPPGCLRGPGGTLWQALGGSAGQGVPGARGPGRAGVGRLGSLVRVGPGRACRILVGIGHFPYCKDCLKGATLVVGRAGLFDPGESWALDPVGELECLQW